MDIMKSGYKFTLIPTFLFFLVTLISAQSTDGHRIEVRIQGYEKQELYLAYYYGDKQYVADTAYTNQDGSFVFEGEENLPAGVYLVVTAPDNNYFEILIGEKEQNFSIRTDIKNLGDNIEIYGDTPSNRVLQTYVKYLTEQRKVAETLLLQKESATETEVKEIDAKLLELEKKVATKQDEIINSNRGSMIAALLEPQKKMDIPVFSGSESEIQAKQFYYYRSHFFDNINLKDSRLLRTPLLFNKINEYETTLTAQHPDSIKAAIDLILGMMHSSEEIFKFYLIHFLNKYAKSKIVGMDAVYVHIVNKYYAKGLAPWTDEEELKKILDNAKALEPILIGKVAPDFTLEGQYGADVSLHKFDAKYTVLYFWRENCGLCVKQFPELKKIYEKYSKDGLKIFTVCTAIGEDVQKNRKYLEDNNLTMFTNAAHPSNITKVMKLYDIKSSPQIFLLDKDKKILSKRIGADQLPEVLEHIINAESK